MGKLLLAEAFSERCARKEGSDAESFFFPPGAPRGREACLCRSSGHRLTALTWSWTWAARVNPGGLFSRSPRRSVHRPFIRARP